MPLVSARRSLGPEPEVDGPSRWPPLISRDVPLLAATSGGTPSPKESAEPAEDCSRRNCAAVGRVQKGAAGSPVIGSHVQTGAT